MAAVKFSKAMVGHSIEATFSTGYKLMLFPPFRYVLALSVLDSMFNVDWLTGLTNERPS